MNAPGNAGKLGAAHSTILTAESCLSLVYRMHYSAYNRVCALAHIASWAWLDVLQDEWVLTA